MEVKEAKAGDGRDSAMDARDVGETVRQGPKSDSPRKECSPPRAAKLPVAVHAIDEVESELHHMLVAAAA